MNKHNDPPIKILLVDDQRLMRDGLRILLEMEEDMVVVGEAENGADALNFHETLQPDVILMDIQMPVMNGVEAIQQLRAKDPEVKVIILTTFDDDAYVFDGLRAGALGYLLKDVSAEELMEAVRTVAAGGALIDPSVTRKVVAEFMRLPKSKKSNQAELTEPLSNREIEVLQLISSGQTNREIAKKLFLAEGTVKNYVSNILNKIGARDRTQAALRARELGLL